MGTVTGDRAAVAPDGSGRSVELAIGGMTCASCAARVEKKLNKLDGVTATVNFATETARVSYPGTASAGRLEVGDGAVGQVAPVRDLPGDVAGDPADGEVRVGVGDNDRHLSLAVEFTGAQRSADPRVAAADGNQVHEAPIRICLSPGRPRSAERLRGRRRAGGYQGSCQVTASCPGAGCPGGTLLVARWSGNRRRAARAT